MFRGLSIGFLTGLLPVLVAVPSAGQPPTTTAPNPPPEGEVQIITETAFLSVLDQLHPAVVERSQELAAARARIVAASTLENPVLGVVREEPDEVEQTDWLLSWQLPQPGRRARISSTEEAARAAESRLSQDLVVLRLAMRDVYADWASAAARAHRLATHAERVDQLATRVSARAERGEASGLEAHRLRLAATGLAAATALAQADAETARAGVASWHPAIPTNARPQMPSLAPPPTEITEHPLVAAARADLAAAELERKAAGRYLRSPELSAGWQRQEVGRDVVDGPTFAFAWPLPLADRNQAQKALADARVIAAASRLEVLESRVDAERVAALANYERLTAAVGTARAALTDNNRMLDAAETAFGHGELTLTDLLETLRSVTEAELTALELQMAALAAHRELERLSGIVPRPDRSPSR